MITWYSDKRKASASYNRKDLDHPGGLTGLLRNSDDSVSHDVIYDELEHLPKINFEEWQEDKENATASEEPQFWIGIMGYSKDSLLFSGKLLGKKIQYIVAVYHSQGQFSQILLLDIMAINTFREWLECSSLERSLRVHLRRGCWYTNSQDVLRSGAATARKDRSS